MSELIERISLFALSVLVIAGTVFAAPWDPLRPVAEFLTQVEPIIMIVVLLASAALLVLAVLAYNKSKSKRLMLVALAFGLFFLKLLLNFIDLDASPGRFMNPAIMGFFDLAVLVVLFYALIKK